MFLNHTQAIHRQTEARVVSCDFMLFLNTNHPLRSPCFSRLLETGSGACCGWIPSSLPGAWRALGRSRATPRWTSSHLVGPRRYSSRRIETQDSDRSRRDAESSRRGLVGQRRLREAENGVWRTGLGSKKVEGERRVCVCGWVGYWRFFQEHRSKIVRDMLEFRPVSSNLFLSMAPCQQYIYIL